MKKSVLFISTSLTGLLGISTLAIADEVDFAKAYVMPNPTSTKELRIGGVAIHSGNATVINWLLLSFNPAGTDNKKATFDVLQAGAQATEPELLQQRLRDTVWSGTYQSTSNIYLTELQFTTVQNGFVGGQITHKTADPEAANLLRADVAGTIVTQYLMDLKGDGQFTWVNADEVKTQGTIPPSNTRYLINLRRLRGLEYRHTSSSWSSQSEYRLTLENNKLTGSVGTPPEKIGKDDGLTGNGVITLEQVPPTNLSPAPILLE